MKVNIADFDLRNMEINQAGELAVRHGRTDYQNLRNPDGSTLTSLSFDANKAFSVKSQFVDDIRFYILGANRDAAGALSGGDIFLMVLDETLDYRNRKQIINLGKYRNVRALTSAVVNGQLIISSPDLPTLWGYTGSGVTFARKQDSVNVTTETISIPNGICVSWAGRCVIAKGEALFVSDPLAPRTYTAGGIVTLPGTVYGLHVGVNGELIAVTGNGVYSLSSQAASQGQNIIGSLQKLSSYRASSYECSALTPNGLYGLTRRGVTRIDTDSSEEIIVSDGSYIRSLTEMINYPDYRVGKLFQTEKGLCLSIGDIDSDGDDDYTGGACMIDFHTGTKSWWTERAVTRIESVFKSREGDDVFLLRSATGTPPFTGRTKVAMFDKIGNTNETPTTGYVSGIVASDLEKSPVVRYVYMSANNGGLKSSCAVRGEKFRRNGTLQEVVTKSNGIVIGTDFWADSMTDKRRYKTAELVRSRFDFAKHTNDISLEVGIQGATARVRVLNLDIKGYGVNTA
ncbi:MAG: hypothetical protein Unbinned1446contig1004_10 [Prokaryotic dsDNA virus sp.]|nr:MAG: hypothetical protein Unbinned1446contig1004_10 [Prokaryotic dsDNA virus sp.]|tara:strand:+ start:15472 stop:17013 length:1542 start_codon:yes stop_codon:yes gene_type:complete